MSAKPIIRIAALTGGQNTPSTRFRVRQHIEPLREQSLEVTEYIPRWGESCGLPSPFKMVSRLPGVVGCRQADLVWLSRDLVQGYATFERMVKRPRILDVDDAIWLSRPFGRWAQPWIAKGMDAVIAGNDYLAEYYSRFCRTIFVVPTAIDTRRFVPRPSQEDSAESAESFVIGWTGLSSNYRYLEMIEPALKHFLDDHAEARLMLISNRPWRPSLIPAERIGWHPWTPQQEAALLSEMTVGLMPLPDTAWTRGKCSFKMLQYMAAGLPVVVSPVGMNRQILEKGPVGLAATTRDEWYQALDTLCRNRSLRRTMGQTGRKITEQFYSVEVISRRLAEIFRFIASSADTTD